MGSPHCDKYNSDKTKICPTSLSFLLDYGGQALDLNLKLPLINPEWMRRYMACSYGETGKKEYYGLNKFL